MYDLYDVYDLYDLINSYCRLGAVTTCMIYHMFPMGFLSVLYISFTASHNGRLEDPGDLSVDGLSNVRNFYRRRGPSTQGS